MGKKPRFSSSKRQSKLDSISVQKLIEKLSQQMIRVTLLEIPNDDHDDPHKNMNGSYTSSDDDQGNIDSLESDPLRMSQIIKLISKKINSFGPATWRSQGLTLIPLIDPKLFEIIEEEMLRSGLLKPYLKIFHVENFWSQNSDDLKYFFNSRSLDNNKEMKLIRKSKYWYDQQEMILKRTLSEPLISVLKSMISSHAMSSNQTIGPTESFIISAVHSISRASVSLMMNRDTTTSDGNNNNDHNDEQVSSQDQEKSSSSSSSTKSPETTFSCPNFPGQTPGPPKMFTEEIYVREVYHHQHQER